MLMLLVGLQASSWSVSRSRWSYLILHCVISLQPEVRRVCHVRLIDTQARTESGPAGLQPRLIQNEENTGFVDTVISNVLRDLPVSRKQQLNSAGD